MPFQQDDLLARATARLQGGEDDLLARANKRLARTFNPESGGYDLESAQAAGLTPDETGHWPSRVPTTGLLLKGRQHPTWPKTVEGERAQGYEIRQGPDRRYYSERIPEFQAAEEQQAIERGEPVTLPRPTRVGELASAALRGAGRTIAGIATAPFIAYKEIATAPARELPGVTARLAGGLIKAPIQAAARFTAPGPEGKRVRGMLAEKYGVTPAESHPLQPAQPPVTGVERAEAGGELAGMVAPFLLPVPRAPKPSGLPAVGRILTDTEVRARRTLQGMDVPTFERRGVREPPNRIVTGPEGERVIPREAPRERSTVTDPLLQRANERLAQAHVTTVGEEAAIRDLPGRAQAAIEPHPRLLAETRAPGVLTEPLGGREAPVTFPVGGERVASPITPGPKLLGPSQTVQGPQFQMVRGTLGQPGGALPIAVPGTKAPLNIERSPVVGEMQGLVAEPTTTLTPRQELMTVPEQTQTALPRELPAPPRDRAEELIRLAREQIDQGEALTVGGEAPPPGRRPPPGVEPGELPEPAGERGAVDVGMLKEGLKHFLKRNFTSKGDLPDPVFLAKIERDGKINSLMQQVAYTNSDFRRAAKEAYGTSRLSDADFAAVNEVLHGQAPATTLPEAIRPVVQRMREELDALSARFIDEGVAEGPLAETIDANMGVYLTRSYRKYDDPAWAKKVSVQVRNKAKALLRQEYPDRTEAEITGLIEELLYTEDSPIALVAKGKLGSKDLSILKHKQDIPVEIRELWGEYKDPRVNYTRSVAKMAGLLENHRFLETVRAEGLGKFFFEKPTEGYHIKFAAEGTKALESLNGLHTSPEIAQAFRDAMGEPIHGAWFRAYMAANGASKFGKTVGSVMTHVRNVLGNSGFALANGHWDVFKAPKAVKAVAASLRWTKDAEYRAYYRELQELGVVHESVQAGELRDVLRDASKTSLEAMTKSRLERAGRAGVKFAAEVYHAEDAAWKVYAYENELARYRAAEPNTPLPSLKAKVAGIVRNTYPTYSMTPRAAKLLRRIPFIGPFVSFPAEVFRTGWHTLALTGEELASANPKVRAIGARRLAGLITATAAIPATTFASRYIAGVGKDKDKAVREFLPPWSENSNLLFLNNSPDGNPRVIDLSYTDPYSYLRTPLMALVRGEDWETKLAEATVELLSPFLSEEILAGKLLDIARNQTKDGRQLWNPQDSAEEKGWKIAEHVYDAMEPGTVSSLRRIAKGITGEPTVAGQVYDPVTETAAMFTGMRVLGVDARRALFYKMSHLQRNLGDAQALTLRALSEAEMTGDTSNVGEARAHTEARRQQLIQEAGQAAQAAQTLGVPQHDIQRLLRSAGLSVDLTGQVLGLRPYRPYQPSVQFQRGLRRRERAVTPTPEQP